MGAQGLRRLLERGLEHLRLVRAQVAPAHEEDRDEDAGESDRGSGSERVYEPIRERNRYRRSPGDSVVGRRDRDCGEDRDPDRAADLLRRVDQA